MFFQLINETAIDGIYVFAICCAAVIAACVPMIISSVRRIKPSVHVTMLNLIALVLCEGASYCKAVDMFAEFSFIVYIFYGIAAACYVAAFVISIMGQKLYR